MKIFIASILLCLLLSMVNYCQEDIPEWYLNYSAKTNELIGKGNGTGKHEAFLEAMADLNKLIETHLSGNAERKADFAKSRKPYETGDYNSKDSVETTGKLSLGNVDFEFTLLRTCEYNRPKKSDQRSSVILEMICRFYSSAKNGNLAALYRIKNEHYALGEKELNKSHVEISEKNCGLADMIEYLQNLGIRFRYYSNLDQDYMMILIDEKIYEEISGNDKKLKR